VNSQDPRVATDLRSNIATWAVPCDQVPAVAYALPHLAPTEAFDPTFQGQDLVTTYFDTQGLALRKARRQGKAYLTLRLRCYQGNARTPEVYALSAKTESEKWRLEVTAAVAHTVLAVPGNLVSFLPGNLAARFWDLTAGNDLLQAASICCRRYAVENSQDRFTLDIDVHTDTGKRLAYAVLEHKSTDADASSPGSLLSLPLRPVKLSKFLWATGV
jgi:hypothetical protein